MESAELTQIELALPAIPALLPHLDAGDSPAAALAEQGVENARSISHPVARARHLYAWALRFSRINPQAAVALLPGAVQEPGARGQALGTILEDRVRAGKELEPFLTDALETAGELNPDARVRVLNSLSELAIELAERDRPGARRLLQRLEDEARALLDAGAGQGAVLACALVGEALLQLDVEPARALLEEAELHSAELPVRDAILSFVASALAELDPARSVQLAGVLSDSGSRFQGWLQLLEKLPVGEARKVALERAIEDVGPIEHWNGPEPVARLAEVIAPLDPDPARQLFERALAGLSGGDPSMRSLQKTGIAGSIARLDRDWAGRLYHEAIEEVLSEAERARRATALVLIANEMAGSHPRDAAEVFARAMAEAAEMEAVWEFAHVLDIAFRPDRSPYLDLSGTKPVLRKLAERISDEDPRIPGVTGLPEVVQWTAQVDPEAAIGLLKRWMAAAERSNDTDGMTQAALALWPLDEIAAREALVKVHDLLLERIDCPAMGDFSRNAAPHIPEMVLDLSGRIPDRRERTDAATAAALHLYEREPERALGAIRGLERPLDRSLALLQLIDRQLGTGDRPLPEPLLEDMP